MILSKCFGAFDASLWSFLCKNYDHKLLKKNAVLANSDEFGKYKGGLFKSVPYRPYIGRFW